MAAQLQQEYDRTVATERNGSTDQPMGRHGDSPSRGRRASSHSAEAPPPLPSRNGRPQKRKGPAGRSGPAVPVQRVNGGASKSSEAPSPPRGQSPEHQSSPLNETAEASPSDQADRLREEGAAVHLYTVVGSIIPNLDWAMFRSYVEKWIQDAGDPTDPVERVMLESLLLTHHCAGQWATKASMATDPTIQAAFGCVATKLLAETRKSGMAIQEYRSHRIPLREPLSPAVDPTGRADGAEKNSAETPPPTLSDQVSKEKNASHRSGK
jgi:hypothetical protein